MRALFFDQSLQMVKDFPKPKPERHEALIRILKAGICNTDLEIVRGYNNFKGIPGHEFVGVVEGVDEPYYELKGKRVVGEINIGCERCEYCLNNLPQHCENRKAIGIKDANGCFAEYITLPVKNLHIVPDHVINENAVFTEPLAAAIEILERVKLNPDTEILVMGDGKLGLITAFALKAMGMNVELLGKYLHKMVLAKKRDIPVMVYDEVLHRKFSLIVDATGKPEAIKTALKLLKPRGTLVLKSTYTDPESLNLSKIAVNEIQILGSRCGNFKSALELLNQGLNLTPLISGMYEFDQSISAYQHALSGEALKNIIHFASE